MSSFNFFLNRILIWYNLESQTERNIGHFILKVNFYSEK